MTTYIMTISTNSNVADETIKRLKGLYSNRQDSFVVIYTDTELPNGFMVTKEDNITSHVVDTKKIDLTGDIKKEIYKQNKIIKDGAKYSKDTSVTKGEKPYEPK